MAVTAITPQTPTPQGTALTYEPANADGNTVDMAAGRTVHVRTGATGATLTLPTTGTVGGLAIADRSVVIPANTDRLITLDRVVRRADGTAKLEWSQVTTVTVAVLTI